MATMWTNAATTKNYYIDLKFNLNYTLDETNECYNVTATPYMMVNTSGSGTYQRGYGMLNGKVYFLYSNNATIKFTDGNNTANVSYVNSSGLCTNTNNSGYPAYQTNYPMNKIVSGNSCTKPPYKFTVPYNSSTGACSFKVSWRDGTKGTASAQDWDFIGGLTGYTYIANNTASKRTDVEVTLPTVEVADGPIVRWNNKWWKTQSYIRWNNEWKKVTPYVRWNNAWHKLGGG